MKKFTVTPFMGATLPANVRFKPTDDQSARFGDRIKKTKGGAMSLVPVNFKRGETVTMDMEDLTKTARGAFELVAAAKPKKGKKPTPAAITKAENAVKSAAERCDEAHKEADKNPTDETNDACVKAGEALREAHLALEELQALAAD